MNARFKELDAFRGFAALSVVFFHLTMGREQAQFFLKYGVTGVDLFFIISGFVIFMSINKVSSVLEFIINRFTRLYPTYWTSVIFTFFIVIIIFYRNDLNNIPIRQLLGNLTMFQYYLNIENIDDCYWTMIIEMIFYIFIAISYSLNILKYIVPLGLTILLSILCLDIFFENSFILIHQKIPLIAHFPLFFSGIIFYKLINNINNTRQKVYNYIYIFICFCAQLILFDKGRCIDIINFNSYVICLVIYYMLFILFVNNKLNFIVSKTTLFFGKISFALYLIHQYVSNYLIIPWLIKYFHSNAFIATSIAIPIVVLLSAIITFYVEIPFSKKLNDFLRKTFNIKKTKVTNQIINA